MPSQNRVSVYLNAKDRAAIERIRKSLPNGERLSVSWIVRTSLANMAAGAAGEVSQ